MDITVGIATTRRPDQVTLTLQQWGKQQRLPDRVVVCPAAPEDIDHAALRSLPFEVEVVYGGKGLCIQRNAIMAHCPTTSLIGFFDDDYYPARDYLSHAERIFSEHPSLVVLTNHPMLDGARGAGVSHEQARYWSEAWLQDPPARYELMPTYGGYGCNMVIKASVARANHVVFDERLPGYGWLEDIDFTRRLSDYGEIAVSRYLEGVHLGTKSGRQNGVRLGYSQVINPLYMVRKGSLSVSYAFDHVARNVAANTIRSFAPEPWVDRRGRLMGNVLAFCHVLRGRVDPAALNCLPAANPSARSLLREALSRASRPQPSRASPAHPPAPRSGSVRAIA